MIILNPEHGAPIADFQYNGVLYFSKESDEVFKPGDMLEFDEEVGNFFLEHYGFLMQLSIDEAKNFKIKKETELKCDECDFVTTSQDKLDNHKETHKEAASLGLKKIRANKDKDKQNADLQNNIDDEATRDGLEGEGLVKEVQRKRIVMR